MSLDAAIAMIPTLDALTPADALRDPTVLAGLEVEVRLELARRYASAGDVLSWGRVLFPHKFYLPFCQDLHQYFVQIKDAPFTSTEAPRGFAKTAIRCFLIPIFMALETPTKYRHYLNVQATATKALSENIAIKAELETNELLRMLYGDQVTQLKWTEKQFELRNGVIFTAVGMGESIRGLHYKNVRPDYIIADDIYDDDAIYSGELVEKINRWFWSALYPARDKTKPHCVHLQGTAIHKLDLLAQMRSGKQVVDNEGHVVPVVSRTFKAVLDDAAQVVLWPTYQTYAKLMVERDLLGPNIFNREYQNERRSDDTSIIKEHWLQYHDALPEDAAVVAKLCGVDPSIGEKERNDFTGGVVVYVTPVAGTRTYKYWVEEILNEHLSLNQRVITLDNWHERHAFTKVLIEGIAGFKDFVAEVKRRTSLPVQCVDSVKSKIANLEREQGKFESKRVSISRKIPSRLRNLLAEQLLNDFPDHDDVRDALLLTLNNKVTTRVTMEIL